MLGEGAGSGERAGPGAKVRAGDGKNEMQQGQEASREQVKAVMFVPYTVGSELARRIRQTESTLQEMTGYRLKIVERSDLKLEDILHKSDPWQGQEWGLEKCLLCITKERTGKLTTQD